MPGRSRWDKVFHLAVVVVVLCLFGALGIRWMQEGGLEELDVVRNLKWLCLAAALAGGLAAVIRGRLQWAEEDDGPEEPAVHEEEEDL